MATKLTHILGYILVLSLAVTLVLAKPEGDIKSEHDESDVTFFGNDGGGESSVAKLLSNNNGSGSSSETTTTASQTTDEPVSKVTVKKEQLVIRPSKQPRLKLFSKIGKKKLHAVCTAAVIAYVIKDGKTNKPFPMACCWIDVMSLVRECRREKRPIGKPTARATTSSKPTVESSTTTTSLKPLVVIINPTTTTTSPSTTKKPVGSSASTTTAAPKRNTQEVSGTVIPTDLPGINSKKRKATTTEKPVGPSTPEPTKTPTPAPKAKPTKSVNTTSRAPLAATKVTSSTPTKTTNILSITKSIKKTVEDEENESDDDSVADE